MRSGRMAVVAALFGVIAGAAVWAAADPPPAPTRPKAVPVPRCKALRAAERVHPADDLVGMTRAQVDDALGGAPVCRRAGGEWVYERWACEWIYQTIVTMRGGKVVKAKQGQIRTSAECFDDR